ncbi:alpha-N-arabinofuranosidase [Favolaschia claudopus]|uniref:Alpha-L-arabinofuranosidase n=1 Tax=Favolaschia claudopus TaxID=2862362 RepID=A0AAW0D2B2_9AGAR
MFPFSSLLALWLAATLVAAGPCDIYASGGTPCVAAHSTTRALFNAYSGPLYQVQRGSDSATRDILPLSAGGVANAATQESFCAGTTCLIHIIYDQSGRSNHLSKAPPGGNAAGTDPGGFDNEAAADAAPVTLNGHKAYGVFVAPGTGYRNDATNGIAVGDAAEGMYAVFDGTHYNDGCCFDYGNAETSSTDTGKGHMETIYFGLGTGFATGAGSGPWVLADLEQGLFTGPDKSVNPNNPTVTSRFVTAVVKGEPGNHWSVRGGNSNAGSLATYYSGVRPSGGYNPMNKEGSIILGIGGDNSNRAQGTFYEGVMTSGYPSDATENSVQADIVAARYSATNITSGPAIRPGSTVSLRATTACCTTRYIAHSGTTVNTQVVTSGDSAALKLSASWNVVAGLANSECVSFESRDTPGNFIRHASFQLRISPNDNSKLFREDATWCYKAGLNGQGNTIRSFNYPAHYFRHYNALMYASSNGGANTFDAKTSFNDDASFVVVPAFA